MHCLDYNQQDKQVGISYYLLLPCIARSCLLLQVLYYGLPAAAAAVFINSKIAAYITSTTISQPGQQLSTVHQAAATAITASAEGSLSDIPEGLQQALLHFSQEAVLFAALPAACYFALGPRVITVKWDSYWITQIFITCLVLFPLVDPVLSGLWTPAVTVSTFTPYFACICWICASFILSVVGTHLAKL